MPPPRPAAIMAQRTWPAAPFAIIYLSTKPQTARNPRCTDRQNNPRCRRSSRFDLLSTSKIPRRFKRQRIGRSHSRRRKNGCENGSHGAKGSVHPFCCRVLVPHLKTIASHKGENFRDRTSYTTTPNIIE